MAVRQGDQITDWTPTVHFRWYKERPRDEAVLQQLFMRHHYYEDASDPFMETIWYPVPTEVGNEKIGIKGHPPAILIEERG